MRLSIYVVKNYADQGECYDSFQDLHNSSHHTKLNNVKVLNKLNASWTFFKTLVFFSAQF